MYLNSVPKGKKARKRYDWLSNNFINECPINIYMDKCQQMLNSNWNCWLINKWIEIYLFMMTCDRKKNRFKDFSRYINMYECHNQESHGQLLSSRSRSLLRQKDKECKILMYI